MNTRRRVISPAKTLFVGPTPATGTHTTGNIKQIHRVQSLEYGFNISRQDVSQFGQLAPIDRIALDPPTVTLSSSYLITDVINERSLGLTTNLATSVLSGILAGSADEKNYFILTVDEGSDAAGFAANSGAVIGIGNGFLNNYSIEASVGGFPTVSFAVEGLNMEGYADPSGNFLPAVNPQNGAQVTGLTFTLPQASANAGSGQPSALRPGDISLNLGGTGSAKFVDFSGISIQSFNCSFDLARESIQALGYKYARSKEIQFPINVNFSVDILAGDMPAGSIGDLLCAEDNNDFVVTMRQPDCAGTGDVALQLDVKNCKLESQNWSASIGPAETVSISWIAQIGGPADLENGLYMSGVVGY